MRSSPAIQPPGQRLVTGDAVNVAARLEQAAPPNEILIGEMTYRLVRDAVEIQPVEPLTLKGKAKPLPAYKLLSVADRGVTPRRHDASPHRPRGRAWSPPHDARIHRLVELVPSRDADRRCRHRQVALDRRARGGGLPAKGLGSFRVAVCPTAGASPSGRWSRWCASLAGIEEDDAPGVAVSKIASLIADGEVVARIEAIVGLRDTQFPLEEIYWAIRKLFQHLAQRAPPGRRLRGRALGGSGAARPRREPARAYARHPAAACLLQQTRPSGAAPRLEQRRPRVRDRASAAFGDRDDSRDRAPAGVDRHRTGGAGGDRSVVRGEPALRRAAPGDAHRRGRAPSRGRQMVQPGCALRPGACTPADDRGAARSSARPALGRRADRARSRRRRRIDLSTGRARFTRAGARAT